MINSVHARRRLIRWLRCCDLCDEAGARGATSAVRVDTWEPFRFLLLGEGFCALSMSTGTAPGLRQAQPGCSASICGAACFGVEATPTGTD